MRTLIAIVVAALLIPSFALAQQPETDSTRYATQAQVLAAVYPDGADTLTLVGYSEDAQLENPGAGWSPGVWAQNLSGAVLDVTDCQLGIDEENLLRTWPEPATINVLGTTDYVCDSVVAEVEAIWNAPAPTEPPTEEPTPEPTPEPTVPPTEEPTEEPTVEPTEEPEPAENIIAGREWEGQGNTTVSQNAEQVTVTVDPAGPFQDSSGTARAGVKRSDSPAVTPGESYTGSFNVTTSAPRDVRVELRWVRSSGGVASTYTDAPLTTVDGTAFVSATAVAPDNAAAVSLRVFVDSASEGDVFVLDSVSVVQEGSVTPDPEPTPEPTPEPEPTGPPTEEPTPEPTDPPTVPAGAPAGPDNTGPADDVFSSTYGSVTIDEAWLVANGETDRVIEDVRFNGRVNVEVDNLVIRDFFINANGASYGVYNDVFDGGTVDLLLEDGEIVNSLSAGLVVTNTVARRLEIHDHQADIIKAFSNTEFDTIWGYDTGKLAGSHADFLQMVGGDNVVLRNSFCDMGVSTLTGQQKSNACAIIQTNNGGINNVLIEGNWLLGGNFNIYVRDKGNGNGQPTNVSVVNNVIDDWRFGPRSTNGADVVWTGNVQLDGTPVN